MTQRKKFLYAGLGLNLVFYTAITIALMSLKIKDTDGSVSAQLSRYLQLRELSLWEKQEAALKFVKLMNEQQWNAGYAQSIANNAGIVAVSKRIDNRTEKIFLDQNDEPVPDSFYNNRERVAIFHMNKDISYLTFLFPAGEVSKDSPTYSVTIEHNLNPLPSLSANLLSDVTILERNWSGTRVLQSTFGRSLREQLRKDFEFTKIAPTARQQNAIERSLHRRTMTLASEKFLVFPVYLINQENFTQVILYTFRVKDFVTFDSFSALLAVILIFCLSTGFMTMAYFWSHEQND